MGKLATCSMVLAWVVFVTGCNQEEMQRKHEENSRRWNDFWKRNDGGNLFNRKSGDTELWTIECGIYEGPQHAEMADQWASALKKVRQLRAERVMTVTGNNAARIYYGEYKLKYVEAKVDSSSHVKGDVYVELNEEIKKDLEFIKTLALGDKYPFLTARAMPKPEDDTGPPEWDLRKAKGTYTLHVGVTYNTPNLHNYKQAAIEWVKALRDDGYEAYYYHAPDKPVSDICVGTFGDDAVIRDPAGKARYSDAVYALRNKADFRYNLENGYKMSRGARNDETGASAKMANESFLVKIPRSGTQKIESIE